MQNDKTENPVIATDKTASFAPIGRTGEHYRENITDHFSAEERETTTLLISGLTLAQDRFFSAALRGLGYRVMMMDIPDNTALRIGKEFGNRGQCNPTYFTVGNLVKYLTYLRDEKGLTTDYIIQHYVYITAGACGPCRFGTYVTEYRKALRDSGFEGFRVLSASQTGGVKQTIGVGDGMIVTPKLFSRIIKAFVLGDILNILMYQIRPYEINQGDTDQALIKCRAILEDAFEHNRSLLRACRRVNAILSTVAIDRSKKKPKVSIIGEFWAMTTEGDGNYKLQAFLESEGAEVDIQPITSWMLYLLWQSQWDMNNRLSLTQTDSSRRGLQGVNTVKKALTLSTAKMGLKVGFQLYAKAMGLNHYQLPNMDEIAELSQTFL